MSTSPVSTPQADCFWADTGLIACSFGAAVCLAKQHMGAPAGRPDGKLRGHWVCAQAAWAQEDLQEVLSRHATSGLHCPCDFAKGLLAQAVCVCVYSCCQLHLL